MDAVRTQLEAKLDDGTMVPALAAALTYSDSRRRAYLEELIATRDWMAEGIWLRATADRTAGEPAVAADDARYLGAVQRLNWLIASVLEARP